MLRASLPRPLARRYLSTSVSRWNIPPPERPKPASTEAQEPIELPPPSGEVPKQTSDTTTSGREEPNVTPPEPQFTLPDLDTPSPTNGNGLNHRQQLEEVRERVKERVRGWTDLAALRFRTKADDFTVHAKTTFSQLGMHLNRVTGYEEIEALKKAVVAQEIRINKERQAAREAKKTYEEAVAKRSHSQREVNDLLARKATWTDADVGHFTTVVREDQLLEQAEIAAKRKVNESEDAVEKEFSKLMRSILDRYHEEQVWSDKIRSASTYGSLAALGLNVLVFVTAILFVEPWKRRRLAATFEEKVEALSRETDTRLDASLKEIGGKFAAQERLISDFAQQVSERVSAPTLVREIIREVEREEKEGDAAVPQAKISIEHKTDEQRQLERFVLTVAGAAVSGILTYLIFGH